MPSVVPNTRISNEKKNLYRLAGEFLVASRLTQRGYMVSLQWGSTISYDLLVFDKQGNVAYIEVKATGSYPRRWILQRKHAEPEADAIPLRQRFVCCVDLTTRAGEPVVYVLPAAVVARGLRYFFQKGFPQSPSLHLSLDFRPSILGPTSKTVGEHIEAEGYREEIGRASCR